MTNIRIYVPKLTSQESRPYGKDAVQGGLAGYRISVAKGGSIFAHWAANLGFSIQKTNIWNGEYPDTVQQGAGLLERYLVFHHSSFVPSTDESQSRELTAPEVALTGRF